MSVGSVTSMNSMSSVQITRARSTDVKSKNIQNEIKDAQQQMQKLSSKEELSVDEKADERKKQQKEITNLNAELERHQKEFLRSQRREMMLAELRKEGQPTEEGKSADKTPTDKINKVGVAEKEIKTTDRNSNTRLSQEETSAVSAVGASEQQKDDQGTVIFKNSDGTVILKGEAKQSENRGIDADKKQTDETQKETKSINDDADKDTGLSQKEIHKMISSDVSAKQTSLKGTVIVRIREGIASLKGEINQDERHGVNTDKKQKELEKLEEKEERARTLSSSVLREENSITNPLENAKVSGIQSKTDNNAVINFSQLSKEDDQEAAQQRFYVSFGN